MPPFPTRNAMPVVPAAAWLPWLRLGTTMAETWLAAAQVIGFRLPLLGMLAAAPREPGIGELRRMIREKPVAFGRAWEAAWWSAMAAPARMQVAAWTPVRRAARANARRLAR